MVDLNLVLALYELLAPELQDIIYDDIIHAFYDRVKMFQRLTLDSCSSGS